MTWRARSRSAIRFDKEKDVRRWFIEQDLIEGVIYLPANLFYNTSAPGVLLFLNKAKTKDRKGKLFLLNASREFTKGDPKNFISNDAIHHIAETFSAWEEVEKYSRIINVEEVAQNGYDIDSDKRNASAYIFWTDVSRISYA